MRTEENKLTHVARAARITKPVHPHAVWHARLTDLARENGSRTGLNEMELRLVAGWERNRAMPEVMFTFQEPMWSGRSWQMPASSKLKHPGMR